MNKLTTGTITRPASMAKAPQLIEDCSRVGKANHPVEVEIRFRVIIPEPKRKEAQQAALVVFFQYRP